MTRNVLFSIIASAVLVFCAAICLAQSSSPKPVVAPRGYKALDKPPAQLASRVMVKPAPAPLTNDQINSRLRGAYNMNVMMIDVDPNAKITKYELMPQDGTVYAPISITDAQTISSYVAVQGVGMVTVEMKLVPGKQYLLDCSLGQDDTYFINPEYFSSGHTQSQWFGESATSMNQHLLIPVAELPAGTVGLDMHIMYKGRFTFYGCLLKNVSQ